MKNRHLLCLCLIGLCICCTRAVAQRSRAALEQRKQESLHKIAEAERILSKTTSVREASIGQLNTLNEQIKAHEALVATLSEELAYINGEISETSQVILSLQEDLQNLRKEYAHMVFWAYKNRMGINQLTFLFSANSFRQFFLRMKYLVHYAEQRQVQIEAIEKVQQALNLQQQDLHGKFSHQQKIFKEEQKRRAQLLSLRKDKQKIIAELAKRSKILRQQLKTERAALTRIDKLIKSLIAKERRRAIAPNPAAYQRLTAHFASNKKKLRWPVQSGIIASKFGRQRHPVFKSIEQDNIGIEIQTPGSVPVHAVFDGVVSEIALIPGMNSVIIIQHGSYRTVYARLSKVQVEKGDSVKKQQPIGTVYTNTQGSSSVHFEVWHNTKKLDPETWLTGK